MAESEGAQRAVADIRRVMLDWAAFVRSVGSGHIPRGTMFGEPRPQRVKNSEFHDRVSDLLEHAGEEVMFEGLDGPSRRKLDDILASYSNLPEHAEDRARYADVIERGANAIKVNPGPDLRSCDLWLTQATSPWWWSSRIIKMAVLGIAAMWRRGWFATIWMTAVSAGIGYGVFRLVQLGGLDPKLAWAPGVAAFFAFPAFWEKVKPAK